MSKLKIKNLKLKITPMNIGGFTLLELVISMAILAIALLGLIQLFPVGLRASKHAGDHTIMTFLGQQKMSDIEQEKPETSKTSNTFFSSPYESFSWRYAVSPDYNNINNLYHATLAIYSNDGADTKIEEFVTLYVK